MATQIQGVLDALRASTSTKLLECDAEAARHRCVRCTPSPG